VRALSEALRIDLNGTGIRVVNIDPGLVETEFSLVRFRGDADRARKVYEGLQPLSAADVADVVLFCATRPPHVVIADVLILPSAQANTWLVHRERS
jgi:NADP-dependent 3-hydroxy acid dehydrogenase YdfG